MATTTAKEKDALLIDSGKEPSAKTGLTRKVLYSMIAVVIFILIASGLAVFVLVSDDGSPSTTTWSPPSACDPLVDKACYLPFPNDYWLSKSSGYKPSKLALTRQTLPKSNLNETIDPTSWNMMDGFSPLPCIMTYFANISLENSNVARLWDVEQSLQPNSPIIILEVSTGKLIPYWVELDYSSDINGGNGTINETNPNYERLLMIWPAYRLNNGERYIVAMRNLKDRNNNNLNATNGFIYFRDNIRSNIDGIEKRKKYFKKYILDELEDIDVDISELQLAWDFTVQSHDMLTSLMIRMKEDAFKRILLDDSDDDYDVNYRILELIDDPYDEAARLVIGQMEVPWYLNFRRPGIDIRVVTENNDYVTPVFQSMEWVNFSLIIPNSVVFNGSVDAKWIEYGHGLFGSYTQLYTTQWRRQMFDTYGYIGIAASLLGMSNEDEETAGFILASDISDFEMIPDRLHQGMLTYLLLNKLCKSQIFLDDPDIFSFNISGTIIDDIVDVDMDQYYYGISQGGIMGSVLLALSDDINRAVLDVPGYPYELLLPRSVDYEPFWNIKKSRYSLEMDRVFLISLQQILWSRLTPSGYISMIKNGDDDDDQKNLLIHYSLGDSEVTWLGAYQMARTLDCFMFDSQIAEGNETIYGIRFLNDDITLDVNSVDDINFYGDNICKIQGWDFNGYPDPPFVNIPPLREDNTHGFTSPQLTAQKALNDFFTEGLIYNTCNGPCNVTRSD